MNSSGMNQNSTPITTHTAFNDVLNLIESAKQRAYRAANTELIDLYWAIGQYVQFTWLFGAKHLAYASIF